MADWLDKYKVGYAGAGIGAGVETGIKDVPKDIPSWLNKYSGSEAEAETEASYKPLISEIGKQALGTIDAAASLAHSFAMFPFHFGAEAAGNIAGALLPGVSGKELAEQWGGAVESVTLKPGMIEEAITLDREGPGRAAGELAGMGFEFILPIREIQHNLSRMKELGVPEGVADQLAFWWSKAIELTAFSTLHKGGVEGAKRFKEKFAEKTKKINEAVEKGDVDGAKANAESLRDLLESEEVKPIKDAIADTPIRKEIEARTAATTERTNLEAREKHEARLKMMKELEDAKRIREAEGRVQERGVEGERGKEEGRPDLERKAQEEPGGEREAL